MPNNLTNIKSTFEWTMIEPLERERRLFGSVSADLDHLKTTYDINLCVALNIACIRFTPAAYVANVADTAQGAELMQKMEALTIEVDASYCSYNEMYLYCASKGQEVYAIYYLSLLSVFDVYIVTNHNQNPRR
jgi:hypothetical protein